MLTQHDVLKDKAHSLYRWLILTFACLMMIGSYYCYDIPAALHKQLDDYMGQPDDFETMFSLLYTVYSVPNVILPFFGGFFVDKFGVRLCLFAFAGFVTLGQVIFAIGVSMKSWPVMFLGRVVFGFGGESLGVANSAVLSVWFKGKELALAFGLNLSISRLGSVMNNLVSPILAEKIGVQFALWFGVILCGVSLACVFLISSIDLHVESILTHQKDGQASALLSLPDDEEDRAIEKDLKEKHSLREGLLDEGKPEHHTMEEEFEASLSHLFTFKQVFWLLALSCVVVYGCILPFNNVASALLLERNYFMETSSQCKLQNPYACQSSTNPPIDCPSSKWYQSPLPINATVDGKVYNPLTADDVDCTSDTWSGSGSCTEEYCTRENDAEVQAATIMSIPYIISACLSPFLGGFVDRYGFRAVIATIAPTVLIIVHGLMGFSSVSPVGPLIGQGLAYSAFAAVLWPSVPLVVDHRLVGFAYGIVSSVQNCGLAAFPLVIASIYSDDDNHYIPKVELFFVGLAVAGVLVGLYLNFVDYYSCDSILNSHTSYGAHPEGDHEPVDSDTKNPMNTHHDHKDKVFTEEDFEDVDERSLSSEIYATSMLH